MARTMMILALLMAFVATGASAAGSAVTVWKTGGPGISVSSASGGGVAAVAVGDTVMAFSKDGGKLWEWKAVASVRHLAFGSKGELYAAYGTSLTKLDEHGKEAWTQGTFGEMAYSLEVLPDGRPVLGYSRGVLCFCEDGEPSWDHYAHEECDT